MEMIWKFIIDLLHPTNFLYYAQKLKKIYHALLENLFLAWMRTRIFSSVYQPPSPIQLKQNSSVTNFVDLSDNHVEVSRRLI